MGEVNFLEESIKEAKDFEDLFDFYEKKVLNKFKSSIIYTDKNLFNYIYCPLISKYFPQAKIFNCKRNPLDNILSIYRANFLNQPFSFSLEDISNYMCIILKLWRNINKIQRHIFEYSYEDLIENPNKVYLDNKLA